MDEKQLQARRMAMSRFIIEFGDRLDGHFWGKAFTQNLKQAREEGRMAGNPGGITEMDDALTGLAYGNESCNCFSSIK